MGYTVHITRQENWCDADIHKMITLEEWKTYIASDSEMQLQGQAEATTPHGETVRYLSEGLAVWLGYSKNGINGNWALFNHSSGNIDVKNPDKEIIAKISQIALRLQAIVQGDEGEMYGPKTYPPALPSSSDSKTSERKKDAGSFGKGFS